MKLVEHTMLEPIDQSIVLGATGVVIGSTFGIVADLVARDRLGGARWGAISGAIIGTGGGIIAVVAMVVVRERAISLTITLSIAREITASLEATSHFNMVAGCLIGLTFSIATATCLVVVDSKHLSL